MSSPFVVFWLSDERRPLCLLVLNRYFLFGAVHKSDASVFLRFVGL